MDLNEKIQFWKTEIGRAEEYDFYFDTQSMREVVQTVEDLQKENEEHCETKGLLGKQVFSLTKRVDELVEENRQLKIEFEKLFDNWALGNFNERQFFNEFRNTIHKFK